jgi:alpha-glucoside transport system permease protein
MSALPQTSAQAQDYAGATVRRFRLGHWLGWFSVRAVLVLICVVWTLPTFGLFVSSLRDKDSLALSGWWTALTPTTTTGQARIGAAETQQQVNGRYVITGSIFPEGEDSQLHTFGGGLAGGDYTSFQPGEVVELENGQRFTVSLEGVYELSSPEPLTFDRPPRFLYSATIPVRLGLHNYAEVLSSQGVGSAFLNSFTVTIPATIIPISIAAFAAYAFAWMEFPGRRPLFYIVVALMVVPLQMSLIPLLRIYSGVGVVGTYPGIWLAHTGFGLPLAIFLLRSYIGGLPRELIESALVDGASHFQIFVRLVLPLSVPALASFAIFQFLWVWNDMLVALVFLGQRQEVTVLTVQLAALVGSRGDNWEILTAAAFVSILVPLIVFFALQRYFVRGLLAGSIKGG